MISEAEGGEHLCGLIDVPLQTVQVVGVSVVRGEAHGGGGGHLCVHHQGDVGHVDAGAVGDSGGDDGGQKVVGVVSGDGGGDHHTGRLLTQVGGGVGWGGEIDQVVTHSELRSAQGDV